MHLIDQRLRKTIISSIGNTVNININVNIDSNITSAVADNHATQMPNPTCFDDSGSSCQLQITWSITNG